MVPRLPPKKMMGANREFIEHRRKSLRRYLNIIARHPAINDDKLLKFFLSFSGSDIGNKLKEQFRGIPDEFMTNEFALKAKDLVPMDTQVQIGNSKDHLKVLFNCVCKLRDIAERMVVRSASYASDMLQFGQELSALSNDASTVGSWATGTNQTWGLLKKGFKHLSVEYAALAEKATQEAAEEEEGIVERLAMFQDLLTAYRDLCDRHEKGVLNDHQKALQKMGQYKKKHMSATVQSEAGQVEQLEHRILEQESQIMNMENRNYFSLHCLQMETQLVHANLDILVEMLRSMVEIQSKSHDELAKVWEHVKPIMENVFPSSESTSASPKTSPLGSPVNDRPGVGN